MKKILYLGFSFIVSLQVYAQNVTITPDGITPALSGTYARLSYDAILALPSPQRGDMVYDITYDCLRTFASGKWLCTYQDPYSHTPNVVPVLTAGTINSEAINDILIGTNNTMYLTGTFNNTITFDTITVTSSTTSDAYIAKLNADGKAQWVRTITGSSIQVAEDIAVDASGNVYVTGFFLGSTNFGGTIINAVGNYDMFVVKYNASGALVWVRTAGSTGADQGNKIRLDASGNVYVGGTFSGTITFGATTVTSMGSTDIFITKYNVNGTVQWALPSGGIGAEFMGDIALDSNGDVFVGGSYSESATFGTLTRTSNGSIDAFIGKYDVSTSSWKWVISIGGTGIDIISALLKDNANSVYAAGSFSGSVNFASTTKTSEGNDDIFLLKYTNDGFMEWVQTTGGTSAGFIEDLAVDTDNNVYLAGNFFDISTIGSVTKSARGSSDAFVARYDANGSFAWVQSFGGINQDIATCISLDANNNIYAGGIYRNTVNFGRTSRTAVGNGDIFVVKFDK
ncbi:hypothetical protein [Emticicia soli]|uniref:Beta-propeller repeat protein n=1 Tax=Emticicia soli TaxID=2027878 RepID=A0ABW5JCS7_9BACT